MPTTPKKTVGKQTIGKKSPEKKKTTKKTTASITAGLENHEQANKQSTDAGKSVQAPAQAVAPVLKLGSILVINNANEYHASFGSYLKKAKAMLSIDASAVEMIDTAIIQLLYAFVTAARAGGTVITWKSPSEEFTSRVRSLGLMNKFGICDETSEMPP